MFTALLCDGYDGTVMGLPLACHGSAMSLPWVCYGTDLELPWDCHETSVGVGAGTALPERCHRGVVKATP